MPELLERGHLYIAQPPLYKIKKGKQERYLKDDLELNNYLLEVALDNAGLHVTADAPPIAGEALESLAKEYLAVMATVKRLSRYLGGHVLEKMIYLGEMSRESSYDLEKVTAWFAELENRLNSDESGASYSIEVSQEDESTPCKVKVVETVHSVPNVKEIGGDFFASAEYRSITHLGKQLVDLLGEGAYVARGDKRQEVNSFKQALNWLMEEAKRGQAIQRYKGLGEMNPEQLWETTMDAETRRLLQVQIEDAVAADQIFTTLMGDQVEPRRDFIEKNALSAANLDI
jgi:DNA gyrase subunit B